MAMGIWLKETLREKGMTIKQLSELSGVSLNTLYSITKRDTERINPVILRQIKKAIGLDKTELEPCPFCGGEAGVWDNSNAQVSYRAFGYGTRGYPTWYKCYCKDCGATGATAHIEKGCENNTTYERWAKEQAIKLWNGRK